MSKSSARPSLAERLAAVAGPQTTPLQVPAAPVASQPAIAVAEAPKPAPSRPRVVRSEPAPTPEPATAKARIGKTMIAGYFTPQMAKAVRLLAVERDTTVQALIGEGLDMVLHKNGKHPMGER